MAGDFRYDILDEVAHRPWPMPQAPWVMTQTWNDLLFAHWRVDASVLARLVPSELTLDRFDGDAWLGIVPFTMTNVSPRGVPALPFVSSFAELNVRTYVTVDGRPGVFFLSLDAASAVAVAAARTLFGLPYFLAAMSVETGDGGVRYESRRVAATTPANFAARYAPAGSAAPPAPGTLEYFLTERYCLYTVEPADRGSASSPVFRVDIHHPPWPLQPASAEIAVNTMADAAGVGLPATPPLVHFARRQDVVAWLPARVPSAAAIPSAPAPSAGRER